jgi:hypothetical protein
MATSLASAAAAILVVVGVRIGPVLVLVSDRYDLGVHLGDVLLGAPLAIAAVLTAVIGTAELRRRHLPSLRGSTR